MQKSPIVVQQIHTRDRIIHAALDHFSSGGYSGTSMRHIARTVGVRESAIYAHFKSKQDILHTLFKMYGPEKSDERLQKLSLSQLDAHPEETLFQFMKEGIEIWCRPEETKIFRLGLVESLHGNADLCAGMHQGIDLVKASLGKIFTRLIKNKRLPKANVDMMVANFFGPLFMLRQEHLFKNEAKSAPKLIKFCEQHIQFFFRRPFASQPENLPKLELKTLIRKSKQ